MIRDGGRVAPSVVVRHRPGSGDPPRALQGLPLGGGAEHRPLRPQRRPRSRLGAEHRGVEAKRRI